MPNFTADPADSKLIRQIARRALDSIATLRAQQVFSIDVRMDLEMVHCNGCPLNLKALLKADELSFAKEITGLRRHVNRNTGKLTGGFLPRFHLTLPLREPPKDPTAATRKRRQRARDDVHQRAVGALSSGA